MKKRLFAIVLSMIAIMSVFVLMCFAGDVDIDADILYDIEFYVENAVADHGDTKIDVGIDIKRNPGLAGVVYELKYDNEAFVLSGDPTLGTLENLEVDAFGERVSPHLGMLTTAAGQSILGNGRMVTYTFDIGGATAGTYPIEIRLSGTSAGGTELKVLDDSFESIATVIYNGSITIPGYTVSFDANGGVGDIEAITKTHGKDIVLPTEVPEKTGYDFLGWSADKNAVTATFEKGGAFNVNADTVLYAVWKKQPLSADILELTVSTESAVAGDQVTVTINATQNPGFNGIGFYLDYDKTRLQYVASSFAAAEGSGVSVFTAETDENMFLIYKVESNCEVEGAIATLKFKVLDEAPLGDAYISIEPDADNCSYLDGSQLPLRKTVANAGTVTVKSPQLLGDINLDGAVNISDAILLFQHSNMSGAYPIHYVGNIDFIKDGKLDINDAIYLFQYSNMPGAYPIN